MDRNPPALSLYNLSFSGEVAQLLAVDLQGGIHGGNLHDLSPEFRATVIDYFIREYEAGRTPNPCVFCNRRIKFGAMWDAARKLGADYLATGHYAKIRQDPATGRHLLCRGADRSKDQSYFLCRLTQEQLSRTLFPLGDLEKPAVRALAEAHGLINALKRDSQDICFVPDGDYVSFITRCVGHESPTGPFVDREGRVLGQHKGFIRGCFSPPVFSWGPVRRATSYPLRRQPADRRSCRPKIRHNLSYSVTPFSV